MRTFIALALRTVPPLTLAIVLAGCLPVDVGDEPAPQPTEEETPVVPDQSPVVVEQPKPAEPEALPPPTIPKVNLTESLNATCLVGVGDKLPEGNLVDIEGTSHAIQDVLGEKLTVLVFWRSDNIHSVVELEDLARDVAGPLAKRGGRIVAVNVGDTAEQAAEAAKKAEVDFLVLVDPEKTYFGKVATERLPRTYVLDATGTILWFDLEYSRTTRRQMERAIDVALSDTKPVP